MKKYYFLFAMGALASFGVSAQSAIDAYRLSQPDLKGTARFMSMGGAFGALGGDLSTLSQNPAGIGVYRSNEIGITVDLDFQNSKSEAQGLSFSDSQTKFLLNNVGGVATLKLPSTSVPNLNFGFTYNKAVSFNRRYRGGFSSLSNSMSNYIAGIANDEGLSVDAVTTGNGYDPYSGNASWLAIMGYDARLINPEGDPIDPTWTAQFGSGTTGSADFNVQESGSVDEYNIAIGGNIANKLFWGMNFDIVNIDYKLSTMWNENLQNAWVEDPADGQIKQTGSQWTMNNFYRANGTGFNYQLGLIYKPIQEFRLGFAFHTPTWYNINETYIAGIDSRCYGDLYHVYSNGNVPGANSYNFSSPWKIIVSAAGVIGSKFIISADYEWTGYNKMKFSEPSYNDYWGYDWDYSWSYDNYYTPANPDYFAPTNQDIKEIYQNTNTLRLGAEYRVTPNFSVRAGYSFVSSPVKAKAKDGNMAIWTAGTIPNYRFDNTTNYITCGLGYRTGGFYIDLAYMYKKMDSEYHAYTPDPGYSQYPSPSAKLSLNNSQLVMSVGYKF